MHQAKTDSTLFVKFHRDDDDEDVGYWLAQSPEARMAAQELNRQVIYGYDSTAAIQRVLEIVRGLPR